MEKTMTYAGFYNYVKNGLNMTKMVTDILEDMRDVIDALHEHACSSEKPLTSYHISIYADDAKIAEKNLSGYKF